MSYFGYRKENLKKSVNVRVNRTIYYFILSPEEVEPDEFEFYLANFLRKIFHYSDYHYE